MDVRALILAVVGVILVVLAGLFPYPLSTIAYIVGVIMAAVGGILFIVSLFHDGPYTRM